MDSKMKEEQISTDKRHGKEEVAPKPDEKDPSPRLPHEMDQSFDQQGGKPRKEIKRALDDIQEGQLDTDRRGMPGVEEVRRDDADATQKEVPASSHSPSSTPKK